SSAAPALAAASRTGLARLGVPQVPARVALTRHILEALPASAPGSAHSGVVVARPAAEQRVPDRCDDGNLPPPPSSPLPLLVGWPQRAAVTCQSPARPPPAAGVALRSPGSVPAAPFPARDPLGAARPP